MSGFVSPIQIPVTTGFAPSIVNCRLEVAGLSLPGAFQSVTRKRTRTRESLYSNNVDPVAMTDGQNAYEAKVDFYYQWYVATMATIQNNFPPGYGSQNFNVFWYYLIPSGVVFDVLIGCKFDSDEVTAQHGTSALVSGVDLHPLKIYFAIPDGATYTDPIYDDNPDPLDTMT